MRCHDHLLELEQRMIGGRRLLLEHVERGARDLARLDRARQRQLVDQAPAGTVDDPGTRLHPLELRLAHEVPRVSGQRRVDRDEVGARQQLVELDAVDAQPLGGLAREVRVEGDDLHTESERAARHLGADPTQADDAEDLAEKLHALQPVLLPPPGLQADVGGRQATGQRQQQTERVLGDRRGISTRGVHHDHATLGRGVDVDRVHAGTRPSDYLETLTRLDGGASHLGGAADDEAFVLADALDELALAERTDHLDFEAVLAERVDADGLKAVGDQNSLHDFSVKIFWAARTLDPKSTGWPISASTCSSAASALMTSNSAA